MTFSLPLQRDDSLSSSLCDHSGGRYKGATAPTFSRRRSGVMTEKDEIKLLLTTYRRCDIIIMGGTIKYNN